MKRPLIIGYGNPLREDDGIGWRAADLLRKSIPEEAADVIQCQQLLPELAAPVEGASLVIFLDAALDQEPGRISLRSVRSGDAAAWSHHLAPGQLLGLLGQTPPAYWITGGISATGWHEGLTAEGEDSAARMAAAALSLLPGPKELDGVGATHTTDPAPPQ